MNPTPSHPAGLPPGDGVKHIIDLAAAVGKVVALDSVDFTVLPPGFQTKTFEEFRPRPCRKKAGVTCHEAPSFIAYVNRHKTEATTLFAEVSPTGATVRAVFDYHTPGAGTGGAAWCDHAATLTCPLTVEWQTWAAKDREPFTQLEFANFLEEHANLFVEPTGAELFNLFTTLEGKADVGFISGVRTETGSNRLTYQEDVCLRGVGEGVIDMPPRIVAGLAPFQGGQKYSVPARLRFKIASRQLQVWYETIAPHVIIREAARQVIDAVTAETSLTPVMGKLN